jgi:hypothetical protein
MALHMGFSMLGEIDQRVSCRTENICSKLPFFGVVSNGSLSLRSGGLSFGLRSLALRLGQSIKAGEIRASSDDGRSYGDGESDYAERNISARCPNLSPSRLNLFSPVIAFIGLIICVGCVPMFVRWDRPFFVVPSIFGIVIGGGIFTAWSIVWPFSPPHCLFRAEAVSSAREADASAPRYSGTKYINILPIVVPELKLRNVQRHMLGVQRANDTTLQDRPETFNSVGVNCADDILATVMAHETVRIFLTKLPVAVLSSVAIRLTLSRTAVGANRDGTAPFSVLVRAASDDFTCKDATGLSGRPHSGSE